MSPLPLRLGPGSGRSAGGGGGAEGRHALALARAQSSRAPHRPSSGSFALNVCLSSSCLTSGTREGPEVSVTIPSPSPGTQGWGAAGAGGGRTLPGRVLVRPRPGRPGVEGAALTLGAAGSPRRRVSLLHPRSGSRTAEPNAANKRTRCTKVGAGRRAEWGAGEAAPRLRGECAAFLPRVFPCRRYPGHRQPPGRLQGGALREHGRLADAFPTGSPFLLRLESAGPSASPPLPLPLPRCPLPRSSRPRGRKGAAFTRAHL